MSDHSDDRYEADGELLSAWLAGDLDAAGAEQLERRLSSEPELAARLERIHDTVIALRGLDDVTMPAGTGERLRAQLDRERPREAVPSLERARERRRSRLPVLAAVAAVVAVLALIPVLSPRGAREEAQVTAARDEPMLEMEEAGGGAEAAAPQAAGEASEAEAAGGAALEVGPVITEGTERTLRSVADDPLLGLPVEPDGRRLAEQYGATIAAAPVLPDTGVAPGMCLDTVLAGQDGAVPTRVEGSRQGDRTVLAYTLVRAAPGSAVLDIIETRVVDATTCAPV